MTIPNNIIVSGKPDQYDQGGNYEKTTDDNEVVAGRFAIKGTADYQWKLATVGAKAQGVFDKQRYEPGLDGNYKYSENYAQDGKSVDVIRPGDCVIYACLKDGQTITKGDLLEVETSGLGKLMALATGIPVAIAQASSSPSGADDDAFPVKFLEGREA